VTEHELVNLFVAMSFALIFIACFVALSVQAVDESVDRFDLMAFASFIKKYNKTYASAAEKASRFAIFQQNMKEAEIYNRESRFAKFAATKFSDMTREEFQSKW
jgi:hypothetical protein